MAIETRPVGYSHKGANLEGMLAVDGKAKRPGVLVCHAWVGRSDFEVGVAKKMAEWGYAGFAVDLYGKGVLGEGPEQNLALMKPFMDDRAMLQERLGVAAATLKAQSEVDSARIAILGFCFGGLCALDMARTGADLKGAVSFHGLFVPPGNTQGKKIKAKVLALHGWDDPMVPPDAVLGFAKEMTEAGADWQIHGYGGTVHGFMMPGADMPDMGIVYSPLAARRGWAALKDFLAETLS
jgi:dienelactone hydrolase